MPQRKNLYQGMQTVNQLVSFAGARPLDREGKKLLGLSPQSNYTDRATAACQRS
jgi:hypothetical protein